jgi:hypothetical protein
MPKFLIILRVFVEFIILGYLIFTMIISQKTDFRWAGLVFLIFIIWYIKNNILFYKDLKWFLRIRKQIKKQELKEINEVKNIDKIFKTLIKNSKWNNQK